MKEQETESAARKYDETRAARIAGTASIHDQINALNALGVAVGSKSFDSGMEKNA